MPSQIKLKKVSLMPNTFS